MLVAILFSTAALCFDNKHHPGSAAQVEVLAYLEVCFTTLFASEVVLKTFVCGWWFSGHQAYLRDAWNVLDFTVVASSCFTLVAEISGGAASYGWLLVFRLLRALRPLRLISRNEGMRVVVNALVLSLGPILNVCLVMLTVFIMFAIMGMQVSRCRDSVCHHGHAGETPLWKHQLTLTD